MSTRVFKVNGKPFFPSQRNGLAGYGLKKARMKILQSGKSIHATAWQNAGATGRDRTG